VSAVQHPSWCFLPECSVNEAGHGTHISSPALVPDPDPGAFMHLELRLMQGAPEGTRLFDVRLVFIQLDPDDDAEPVEFPLSAEMALGLAEQIQRMSAFAGWEDAR